MLSGGVDDAAMFPIDIGSPRWLAWIPGIVIVRACEGWVWMIDGLRCSSVTSVKSRSLRGSFIAFSVADLDMEGATNLDELPSDEPPCVMCEGEAGAPAIRLLDALVDLFPFPLGMGIGEDPQSSLRSFRSVTAARTSA